MQAHTGGRIGETNGETKPKASLKDKKRSSNEKLKQSATKVNYKSMAKQERQKPEAYQGKTRGAGRSKNEKIKKYKIATTT